MSNSRVMIAAVYAVGFAAGTMLGSTFAATELKADAVDTLSVEDCRIVLGPDVVKLKVGFCRIANSTARAVSITAIEGAEFERAEIHRSVISDGIASMEHVARLTVSPGQVVVFKPEGLHFMLRPKGKLTEGQLVPADLKLSAGKVVPLSFKVVTSAKGTPSHAAHDHHNHSSHDDQSADHASGHGAKHVQ